MMNSVFYIVNTSSSMSRRASLSRAGHLFDAVSAVGMLTFDLYHKSSELGVGTEPGMPTVAIATERAFARCET
jgi:hypothetical protein